MQKVQSYLCPNRVILIADLTGFTVEKKTVYARTVKIYKGVDNVIQFDVQNAEEKRIDLTNLFAISKALKQTLNQEESLLCVQKEKKLLKFCA